MLGIAVIAIFIVVIAGLNLHRVRPARLSLTGARPMAERGAALITGGARRIGRALVAAAADAGYDVAIHVRAVDDEAEAAAAEVRARGRKRRHPRPATCARKPPPSPWWARPRAELGPVTLLVNCASVFEEDAFADMNRASWDAHMETNLRAPLVLAQAFARRLPAGPRGPDRQPPRPAGADGRRRSSSPIR